MSIMVKFRFSQFSHWMRPEGLSNFLLSKNSVKKLLSQYFPHYVCRNWWKILKKKVFCTLFRYVVENISFSFGCDQICLNLNYFGRVMLICNLWRPKYSCGVPKLAEKTKFRKFPFFVKFIEVPYFALRVHRKTKFCRIFVKITNY